MYIIFLVICTKGHLEHLDVQSRKHWQSTWKAEQMASARMSHLRSQHRKCKEFPDVKTNKLNLQIEKKLVQLKAMFL